MSREAETRNAALPFWEMAVLHRVCPPRCLENFSLVAGTNRSNLPPSTTIGFGTSVTSIHQTT